MAIPEEFEKTCKATPDIHLEAHVMSQHTPKSEALWWAKRRIEELLQIILEKEELSVEKIFTLIDNINCDEMPHVERMHEDSIEKLAQSIATAYKEGKLFK